MHSSDVLVPRARASTTASHQQQTGNPHHFLPVNQVLLTSSSSGATTSTTSTTTTAGRIRNQQHQQSRLTWTFALCALLSMGSFFIGHVALSNWLVSEQSFLERSRLNRNNNRQAAAPPPGEDSKSSKLPPVPPIVPIDLNQNTNILRILVFGSHHTGTSVATKLLIEAGAYPGEDLVMLPNNALKYNENRQAVDADKRIMVHGHDRDVRDRIGPYWVDFGFKYTVASPTEQAIFQKQVDRVIANLEQGTVAKKKNAWVLKDPRMCILAEHYVSKLPSTNNVCVLVTRNPFEASKRLARKYNQPDHLLTVQEWMEFWGESMITAAKACLKYNRKIVFASHSDMVRNPLAFAQKLEQDIFGEIRHYRDPSSVTLILGEKFQEKSSIAPEESGDVDVNSLYFTPYLKQIWEALRTQDLSRLPPKIIPMTPTSRVRKQAYATIVTGNSKGFVAGAIALAQSIRRYDKDRDMVAMLSIEVTDETVVKSLQLAGFRTVRVDKLEEPWYQVHPKCTKFSESQQVRWGRMFSKLRVYSLPYERVVYLDTDTIVLRSLDPYFTLPGHFYAERSPSHRGINAGIMIIRPSEDVLRKLITYAKENEPMQFWPNNQVGCTEQELLNRFWDCSNFQRKLNNTRHFDYLTSPFVDDVGRQENRLDGARIAHCLTTKCPKPWDLTLAQLIRSSPDFSAFILPRNCDILIYLTWYELYLSPEMDEARKVLLSEGGHIAAGMIPDSKYGLKQVREELEQLKGPSGINYRRDWRESAKDNDQTLRGSRAARSRRTTTP